MTENLWIALMTLAGVSITAVATVVAAVGVAIINQVVGKKNASESKGLEVAEAQDRRIRALERQLANRPVQCPRPTARRRTRPTRKGSRP